MFKTALRAAFAASVLTLSALGIMPEVASAAACIANTPIDVTNPDAQLTNATSCGVIDNLQNANPSTTETAIEAATGLSLTFIDRDNNGNNEPDNNFLFTGTTGGNWAIDTTGLGFTKFVVSFKDGAPLSNGLVYFVIDTTINTPSVCSSPYELCGTWLMYGSNGTRQSVSHADLLAYNGTTTRLPEPGALLLFSSVLGAIGITTRRKKAK